MAKKKTENKKPKMADIRALTDDQVAARVTDVAKERMGLRFQKATGQQENPAADKLLRKEVARLKTEQSARRAKKTA